MIIVAVTVQSVRMASPGRAHLQTCTDDYKERPTLVIPCHWVGRVCIVSRYHSGGARLSRGQKVGYTNYVGHLAHRVRLPIVNTLLSTGYQP